MHLTPLSQLEKHNVMSFDLLDAYLTLTWWMAMVARMWHKLCKAMMVSHECGRHVLLYVLRGRLVAYSVSRQLQLYQHLLRQRQRLK